MLTGVILAGGRNRRMDGVNKALLPFSNESLIQRQIRLMQRICSEIILVTNEPRPYLQLLGNTVRIITDYFPGKGPLSGMHAAITLSRHPDLWIVGCDMPFVSPRAAELMWDRKKRASWDMDAIIPKVGGIYYPLHGIYDKRCGSIISNLLDLDEYDAQELLKVIHYEVVDEPAFVEQGIDPRFIQNINTQEEYESALQMISSAAPASQSSLQE